MNEPSPRFDHEKLEVYRLAVDATIWVGTVLLSSGARRSALLEQLDRSSSGIPLNIAEGNGRRTIKDRCRFFDIALSSANECGATLDVMVGRGELDAERAEEGRRMFVRIVQMLSKLIQRKGGLERG